MKKLLVACTAAFMVLVAGPTLIAATPAAYADVCPANGCISSKPKDVGIPEVTLKSGSKVALDLLSFLAGVLSVVMLILGGIRYMTSGGNSQRVESAKNTLLYAVIGLIVSILAYTIIGFVLTKFF